MMCMMWRYWRHLARGAITQAHISHAIRMCVYICIYLYSYSYIYISPMIQHCWRR